MNSHPDPVVDPHPYNDAMVAAGLLFSGCLPLRETGSAVGGRWTAHDEAMATARRRLDTVGARLEEAVEDTYFVTDISLRDEADEQFSRLGPAPRPARTLVEVSGFPYGVVVEIDIVGRAG